MSIFSLLSFVALFVGLMILLLFGVIYNNIFTKSYHPLRGAFVVSVLAFLMLVSLIATFWSLFGITQEPAAREPARIELEENLY